MRKKLLILGILLCLMACASNEEKCKAGDDDACLKVDKAKCAASELDACARVSARLMSKKSVKGDMREYIALCKLVLDPRRCVYDCENGTRKKLPMQECQGFFSRPSAMSIASTDKYLCIYEDRLVESMSDCRPKDEVLRELEEQKAKESEQKMKEEEKRVKTENLKKELNSISKSCKEQIVAFLKKENREPNPGEISCEKLDANFSMRLNDGIAECQEGDAVLLNVSYSTHKENIVVKDCAYWANCKKKTVFGINSVKWSSSNQACGTFLNKILK